MTPNFDFFIENILNHLILESVTFSISEETRSVNDLLGLSNSILYSNEFSEFPNKILTGEEKNSWLNSRPTPEFLTTDGDDFDKKEGILNFYTGGLSNENAKKILEFIKYYVGEYNGQITGEIREEESRIYKSKVFRIPVKIKENLPNSPELNISNMNARAILVDVLNYPDEIVDNTHQINANELLMKISSVEENDLQIQKGFREKQSGENSITFGLTTERIREILNKLKEIAEYAINNNYTYVSLS